MGWRVWSARVNVDDVVPVGFTKHGGSGLPLSVLETLEGTLQCSVPYSM